MESDLEELIQLQNTYIGGMNKTVDELVKLAVSSEKRMETTNEMIVEMKDHCKDLADIFTENIAALRQERDVLSQTNLNLTVHNDKLIGLINDLQRSLKDKDDLIQRILIESLKNNGTNINFGDVAGSKIN